MSILIQILLAVNVLIALLLILVTLMQRPKQEGLGAAFGGGMTENLFGAQTTNVLVSITRWLGGIFLVLAVAISALYSHQARQKSGVEQELLNAPAVEAPAEPKTEAGTDAKESDSATPAAPTPAEGENAAPSPAPSAEPTATPEATPAQEATPAPAAEESTPAAAATPEADAAAIISEAATLEIPTLEVPALQINEEIGLPTGENTPEAAVEAALAPVINTEEAPTEVAP